MFDEFEKAHLDISNLLLQLFDEGILTDGLGRKVDFRNTIIIMTSNLGTKEIKVDGRYGFVKKSGKSDYKTMQTAILDRVKNVFSPELLNRIDETIVFHMLDETDVLNIIDLQLKELIENLQKMDIKITVTKRARKLLVNQGFHEEYGARNLRRTIQNSLEDPISELLLENKFTHGDKISVDSKKGELKFSSAKKLKNKSVKQARGTKSAKKDGNPQKV